MCDCTISHDSPAILFILFPESFLIILNVEMYTQTADSSGVKQLISINFRCDSIV